MGVISKAIDKLPSWVQGVLVVLGFIVGAYGVAHYGWSFILHAILSPEP